MVNRIRKTDFVPAGNGQSVGNVVNSKNEVIVDFGNGVQRALVQQQPLASRFISVTSGNVTLTPAQSGSTVVFDSTTSRLANLPAAASCPSCVFKFAWKQLTSASTGHGLNPVAADYVGGGITGLTVVVNKDLYSAQGTDTINDRLTVESNGVNGWIVTEAFGTFSKES